MRLNKRGEISVTILVIGVFILCGLAMFTFFISDFKLGNSFVGISIAGDMNQALDEYYFYKNTGKSFDVTKTFFKDNIIEENNIKYMYFEKKDFGFFNSGEGELLFSIKYPIAG